MTDSIRSGFLITTQWLVARGACAVQVGRFRNVYTKGMRINTRNLNIARSKYGLNTRWLIAKVLVSREEAQQMSRITKIDYHKNRWTRKDATRLHPAFVKVLNERDK